MKKKICMFLVITVILGLGACGTTGNSNDNKKEVAVSEETEDLNVLDKKVEIAIENLEAYEKEEGYSIAEIGNVMTYEKEEQFYLYVDYILEKENISDAAILCLNQNNDMEWCYCTYSTNEYYDKIAAFSYDDFLEYDKYKLQDKYTIGLSPAEKEKNLIIEAATKIRDRLLNRDSLQIRKVCYLQTGIGVAEGIAYIEYSAQNKGGGYSSGSCYFRTKDWVITEIYDDSNQYMQDSIMDIYGDYTWTEYDALEIEKLVKNR